MGKGYVYFILENRFKELGFDFIKIGYTSNNRVSKRLVSLQIGNPRKLEVLCVLELESLDRAKEVEVLCHDVLREYCVSGEWFQVTPEVRDFVLDTLPTLGTLHSLKKIIPAEREPELCSASLHVDFLKAK